MFKKVHPRHQLSTSAKKSAAWIIVIVVAQLNVHLGQSTNAKHTV